MSQIGGNRHNYMEYGQKQTMWGYDISCSKNNILIFSMYRDFPSIGFLPPPPTFCLVPLSPSLAAALGPLAFTSRSHRPPSL